MSGAAGEGQRGELERLRESLRRLETCGIVEFAVINPNVADYMRHWEGRAEAAEAKLAKAEEALTAIGNIAYNMKQKPVGWNAEEQFARIQRLADAALAGQPDPEYSAKAEGRS